MAKKHLNEFWGVFAPHTSLKHQILKGYISAWLQKVVRGIPGTSQVLLLDAFAGEGADHAGNLGSPALLAQEAAKAASSLKAELGKDVIVNVVAIERSRSSAAKLAGRLGGDEHVKILRGSLESHLDSVLENYEQWPMMSFLDPFGVKGLEAETVRRLLSQDGQEALILFNDPGAYRLAGAAKKLNEESPGLSGMLELFAEENAEPIVHPWVASLAKSREVLVRAFGTIDWEKAIAELPTPTAIRAKLIELYLQQLRGWGATYTTRIPIWDENGNKKYTLLHASRSRYGRSTIKEETCRALRNSSLPESSKEMIRWDLRVKPSDVYAKICAAWTNTEMGWSEANHPSLRSFILWETDVFPDQLTELQQGMTELGWRIEGRPVRFRIP